MYSGSWNKKWGYIIKVWWLGYSCFSASSHFVWMADHWNRYWVCLMLLIHFSDSLQRLGSWVLWYLDIDFNPGEEDTRLPRAFATQWISAVRSKSLSRFRAILESLAGQMKRLIDLHTLQTHTTTVKKRISEGKIPFYYQSNIFAPSLSIAN